MPGAGVGVSGVRGATCAEGERSPGHREPVQEGVGGEGLRAVGQRRPPSGERVILFFLWLVTQA